MKGYSGQVAELEETYTLPTHVAEEVLESFGSCLSCRRKALLGNGLCVDCFDKSLSVNGLASIPPPSKMLLTTDKEKRIGHKLGRPRKGKYVYCKNCGKLGYRRQHRINENPKTGEYCKKCYNILFPPPVPKWEDGRRIRCMT